MLCIIICICASYISHRDRISENKRELLLRNNIRHSYNGVHVVINATSYYPSSNESSQGRGLNAKADESDQAEAQAQL